MYEFTKIERITPFVRPYNERVQNFKEISVVFEQDEAASQASRCVQCGNPYCASLGCPLNNYIPQWLKFIAEKDLSLAFQVSNETSPFPEILGRICPHDRLCEGACTLNDGNADHLIGAVTIGSVEVAISEQAIRKGMRPEFAPLNGKTVGIIGSGPAGLSCATFLLRAGIKPIIYERADQAGGLLTYGIPGFKLEKQAVSRRIEWLQEAGMELHLGVEIGKDIPFEEIYERHDAVFIGVGATAGRQLDAEEYANEQIYMAVPFLTNIQKKLDGHLYDRKYQVAGKRVLVIGGGDTAMDCVRTSVREGASRVTCVYRRDEANMPGSRKEVSAAKEEGVEFLYMKTPQRLLADEQGRLLGARFVDTEFTAPDAKGRQSVQEVPGSEQIIEADIVILALGFSNERLTWLSEAGIKMDRWGAIQVDANGQTSRTGVYAGGDGVRGADLVVTAALDGREAAYAMLEHLLVVQSTSVGQPS